MTWKHGFSSMQLTLSSMKRIAGALIAGLDDRSTALHTVVPYPSLLAI
jgi:hypothetical protein